MGVTIDSNLSFSEHVTIFVQLPIVNYMLCHVFLNIKISLKKRHILMTSFIISQSSYCSLMRITHSRGFNNRINHIHERVLCILCKNFSTSFVGLLARDRSATIHIRNLQQLAIEIFKVKWESPQL